MLRKSWFLLLLLGLCLSAAAQPPVVLFPLPDLNSLRYVAIKGDAFAISNKGAYFYACEFSTTDFCQIFDDQVNVLDTINNASAQDVSWSYDNQRLVTLERKNCETVDNLHVFTTSSQSIDFSCFSLFGMFQAWSPVRPDQFYVEGEQARWDMDEERFVTFTPSKSLNETQLETAIGYQDYFWDTTNEQPIAKLHIKMKKDANLVITQSDILACTLNLEQCVTLLDTLNSSPLYLRFAKLNGSWLLWGGNLGINAGESAAVYERTADVIFYITYMPTMTTQEVFRLSDLAQPYIYVDDISWSPDRNTLALAVQEINQPLFESAFPPKVEAKSGTILFDLQWNRIPN
jgi:hypothetical protein